MKSEIKDLLTKNMLEFWQRIYEEDIQNTLLGFKQWKKSDPEEMTDTHLLNMLCRYIVQTIEDQYKFIENLNERYSLFSGQVQRAVTPEEQWQHQMKFLQFMGCTKSQLQKIKKAKKRWFGNDAIKDRYLNTISKTEHYLSFLLERLGQLIQIFSTHASEHDRGLLLKALKLDLSLNPLLLYENDERVTYEAFRCVRISYSHQSSESDDSKLIQHIYRIASDPHQPIWVQTEALALLFYLDKNSCIRLLQYRLGKPSAIQDDIFFRARALDIAIEHRAHFDQESFDELIIRLQSDPSPFVRQALANAIPKLPKHIYFQTFEALTDSEQAPEVQAKAWLILLDVLRNHDALEQRSECSQFIDRYLWALTQQPHILLLRLLMELAADVMQCLLNNQNDSHIEFYQQCLMALTNIHTNHSETRIRRWAAQSRELLWHVHQPKDDVLQFDSLETMSLEEQMKIKRPTMGTHDFGRHLAALGHKGFGYDISVKEKDLVVRSGYTIGFRLWRFFHEFMTPSTDKRQNHNHMQGKHYFGNMLIPTQQLGESSETQVPGEPVILDHEQGWRPYLPLVDQILSSLDQGWPTQSIKLFTSEGITEILPPSNVFKRVWAKLYISFKFKHLASLRNWQETDTYPAHSYLQAFVKLGFQFRISSYHEQYHPFPQDARVSKFFPSVLPVFAITEFWRDIQNYFYSVYQNTLEQLGVFLVAISAVFFGQHFWLNQKFRKARSLIPLVIGGWGTRGKSGTERLKSALFNGQGISLVSKSTGCEAQFLYAPMNRPLRELFLFRPYDKASIWEQLHLTRLASKLKVKILLWECMGLTPRYISILQEQWMRDDLSTITNCYPDHEDIQGPSGIDIPKVMMRFVPKNATLISSEDSMSPLLESAARNNNSRFRKVSWIDANFIAPDILARFPYEEHPTNIALVLKMADELGFPKDMALKSMADYVIPDLGVLRVYPQCEINHRRFIFINGMSANERLAALNNWHRLKLDKISIQAEPNTWLSTVVNNRADRISRSQVFAKMLVNDLSADQHFLIGSNIDGLFEYIEEQWNLRVIRSFSQSPDHYNKEHVLNRFEEICRFIRLPINKQQIALRLQSMLKNLCIEDTDKIVTSIDEQEAFSQSLTGLDNDIQTHVLQCLKNLTSELHEYENVCERIKTSDQALPVIEFQEILWNWFRKRLVIVEDQHIQGNELIRLMMDHTPPGLCNKMIGLQNIKGTGLDFVYRWQAWDKVHSLCQNMMARQASQALSAAKELASIREFGLLDEQLALKTCQDVRNQSITQTELFQAELNTIESNVKQQLDLINRLSGMEKQESLTDSFISAVESFLDAGQSVKRKKIALQIYDDLASENISINQAISELNKLNQEQKGGWLKKILILKFKFIQ